MGRSFGRTLGGVLLLVLGILLLAWMLYSWARDLSIWVLGQPVEAEVVELWVERTSDNVEGDITFRYFVRYRFQSPSGEVFIRTSAVDVREWGSLSEGGTVDVVYFPLYPQHSRLDEARFVSLLGCAYIPFTVVALASLMGGWYLLRPTERRRWWFSRKGVGGHPNSL